MASSLTADAEAAARTAAGLRRLARRSGSSRRQPGPTTCMPHNATVIELDPGENWRVSGAPGGVLLGSRFEGDRFGRVGDAFAGPGVRG